MQWQSYETGEGASAYSRPLPSTSALFRLLMFTFALFYRARQSLVGKKSIFIERWLPLLGVTVHRRIGTMGTSLIGAAATTDRNEGLADRSDDYHS